MSSQCWMWPRSHLGVSALFLQPQHWCDLCLKPHYLVNLVHLFTHFLVSLCFLLHPSTGLNCMVQADAVYWTWWSQHSAGQAPSADSLLSAEGEPQSSSLSKDQDSSETDLACPGFALMEQISIYLDNLGIAGLCISLSCEIHHAPKKKIKFNFFVCVQLPWLVKKIRWI